ncbi:hypothetical protein E8E15_000804 [Penicillium rubens]|nr:hypothetical protein E8E15_000804 [Penicillium rubens]KAI2669864.1 hypothetical protein LCP963914a_9884 [Penicillium roqueforti]KAJ5051062.1 hypothetical protein NUH16_011030 [Penicillium rubens]
MLEAKQALADCPAYHRVPLHFRVAPGANTAATSPSTIADGIEASIHAPERQQEESLPDNQRTVIDLHTTLAEAEITPDELAEPAQPKGPGRPKGSRTRLKDPKPPMIPLACQRATRLQVASQKAIQDQTNSKRRRTAEPEKTMDEQPDDNDWFNIQLTPADFPQANTQQDSHEDRLFHFISEVTNVNHAGSTPGPEGEGLDPESPEYRKKIILKYKQQQAILIRSSPSALMTDAPTIEDPHDEVWHEASERSDDEQTHQ